MVPFAGYEMPVQYPTGILKEHAHTRAEAGLFDVSHMGQVRLVGAARAAALESLVPVDVIDLGVDRQRYALFTNDRGGILDDLMIANFGDHLLLVVNAACKRQDVDHLRAHLSDRCEVEELADRALLALQGPKAGAVLARLAPEAGQMTFMTVAAVTLAGARVLRQPVGLHRRGRFRDLTAGRPRGGARATASCPTGGRTDRTRCARFAAPRSGSVPVRSRHRRDDDAGRGEPRVGIIEVAPRGRRAPRRLSGRRHDHATASGRRRQEARRPSFQGAHAGARGSGTRRCRGPRGRQGDERRLQSDAGRAGGHGIRRNGARHCRDESRRHRAWSGSRNGSGCDAFRAAPLPSRLTGAPEKVGSYSDALPTPAYIFSFFVWQSMQSIAVGCTSRRWKPISEPHSVHSP